LRDDTHGSAFVASLLFLFGFHSIERHYDIANFTQFLSIVNFSTKHY